MRKLQNNELTLEQLKQESDTLSEKKRVLGAIQFGEDSIKILTDVPRKLTLVELTKWIAWKGAKKFLKKMKELNDELISNLKNGK